MNWVSLEDVKAALSNSGGFNWKSERFAGEIARPDVDRVAILHSLILSNGVRKTTNYHRNSSVVQRVIASMPHSNLRVLDVGSSSGADALDTLNSLGPRCTEYVLADLFSQIFVDPSGRLIFDEDMKLIQARLPKGFISFHYSYAFKWQRYLHLLSEMMLRQIATLVPTPRDLSPVSLLEPALLDDSRVRSERFDVFKSFVGEFDLVICLHLLVPRYFTTTQIEAGIANLKHSLAEGGLLVVGDAENPQIFRRKDGKIELHNGKL